MSVNIQSILFNKKAYTREKAKEWLSKHNYINKKVDETQNYLRYRQLEPKKRDKYAFISFNKNIKGILKIK